MNTALLALLQNDFNEACSFAAYLNICFQDQYLQFWLAVEEYKTMTDTERTQRALEIYEEFFVAKSAKFLNLDQMYTAGLEQEVAQSSSNCFERVQTQTAKLLSASFVTSPSHKNKKMESDKKKKKKKLDPIEQSIYDYITQVKKEKEDQTTKKEKFDLSLEDLSFGGATPIGSTTDRSSTLLHDENAIPTEPQMTPRTRDGFVQILVTPPFTLVIELIASTIASQSLEQELCDAIIDVFLFKDKITELFRAAISMEINDTKKITCFELFKQRSIVGHLFYSLIQRVAPKYRESVLLEEILQFIRYNESGFDPAQDIKKLETEIDHFLTRLDTTKNKVPKFIKQQFMVLKDAVNEKYPGKGNQAVGSVFFYHFFYRSIVHSDWTGAKIKKETRKSFSSIGKTILYISSSSSSSSTPSLSPPPLEKSSFLSHVTLESRQSRVEHFIECLLDAPKTVPSSHADAPTTQLNFNSGSQLIKDYTMDNLPKLWGALILHPDVASLFFPFVLRGLENLCKVKI